MKYKTSQFMKFKMSIKVTKQSYVQKKWKEGFVNAQQLKL